MASQLSNEERLALRREENDEKEKLLEREVENFTLEKSESVKKVEKIAKNNGYGIMSICLLSGLVCCD